MALPAVIEPCLPSSGEQPPTGADWVHEIKHDGYRLMARRDVLSVGIRLLTRNGHDWAARYPLIVRAVNKLKVRSCLIDGEAVCCNERGVSSFDKLRHRSHDPEVFLVAFDLLELDGQDLRREPLEVRKQTLASLLRGCSAGAAVERAFRASRRPRVPSTPASWGWRASCRSGSARATSPVASKDWLKFKNPDAPAVKREAEEEWGKDKKPRQADGAKGQRLGDFAVAALAFERGLVVAATDSTALVTELASRHPPLNSTGVPVSEGLRPIDAQFYTTRRYLR